jgi:hypothetical protein
VISVSRIMLSAAVAACALAAGSATAGVAKSSASFSCSSEQAPPSAYKTWQKNLINSGTSTTAKSRAVTSAQPEWLASFGTMITPSTHQATKGQDWFTWDHNQGGTDVKQAFAFTSSYIMEGSQDQVSSSGKEAGWPAKPTTVETYKNAWDLISALDPEAFGRVCAARLFTDVGAVLYDTEDWTFTPGIEKEYPAYYVEMIAYYVHLHNSVTGAKQLKLFVAPAISLSNTVLPTHGKGAWNYLADKIPALVSTPSTTWNPSQTGTAGTDGNFGKYVASDIDIQAQQSEPVVTGTNGPGHVTYQYIVKQAADQIAVGDPGATLFAGLTTNNTGGTGAESSVPVLQTAASKVQGIVSGFWLNDSPKSSQCPTCTGTYPDIADGSLRAIDASPTW